MSILSLDINILYPEFYEKLVSIKKKVKNVFPYTISKNVQPGLDE